MTAWYRYLWSFQHNGDFSPENWFPWSYTSLSVCLVQTRWH